MHTMYFRTFADMDDSVPTAGLRAVPEGSMMTLESFEALFRAWYSPLCAYANHFLRDVDASEDVVQEVLIRVWERRESLLIDTSVKSYLFRAVRNTCMNAVKHQQVMQAYQSWLGNTAEMSVENGGQSMMTAELERNIREAIDRLPVERRKVFVLSRYDGLTYLQIAEKLGLSVKTVENQMGSALRSLRGELKDYLPIAVLLFRWIWN